MSETNRIEYKRELNVDVDIEKETIAFLNSHGGGLIYIGIDKAEKVVGLVDGLVDGLVESQQQIIHLIKTNPKISKKSMAEHIGISTTAIDKHIRNLRENEIIGRVGSDRYGYWVVLI